MEMIVQKILAFLGFVIQTCLVLAFSLLGIVLLAFPVTYDISRFLAWKLSTQKFHRKWYRKALRRHVTGEMHRFRYGWYDLYVSENGQVSMETRGRVPTFEDLHLAKPGNEYWRAYVRQQMLSFRPRFSRSETGDIIGTAYAFASL